MKTAVVVPTIREEQWGVFIDKWHDLFCKHNIHPHRVVDGEKPTCDGKSVEEIMGEHKDLIYNFNDGVRNLGFALAYKEGADVIISLDDDVWPNGDHDPIQEHLDALNMRVPITWMNSTLDTYMRGFPYGVRDEAEVVFSHGVWLGVADFDASTQLVQGVTQQSFRRMAVPRGVLMPVCAMNVAFKRKVLPYYYQAPMFGDINRFADIWAGIEAKKAIDEHLWAMVTGYSTIWHSRASDPFANLIKEAKGVKMNEKYGEGEYFELYRKNITRWQEFLNQ
jgi:hypothetical protein